MKIITSLFLTLSVVGLAGCESASWSDPSAADVFEQFLLDVYLGQKEAAFEAIAPNDRERLVQPRTKLRVPEEQRPKAFEMLMVAGIENPYEIKKVDTEPKLTSAPVAGTKVKLKVTFDGDRSSEASMIWDGQRWYVDLPLEETKG